MTSAVEQSTVNVRRKIGKSGKFWNLEFCLSLFLPYLG